MQAVSKDLVVWLGLVGSIVVHTELRIFKSTVSTLDETLMKNVLKI